MTPTPTSGRQLTALEKSFWLSGAEFYEQHLAEECLMLFPGVGALTRDAIVEGIRGGARWSEVEMSDVRVVRLGETAAILACAAAARREGLEEQSPLTRS
ncbi:MAG TPA: DUF4440 domain-containing protein [Vicinamibacterales bacterium]|nr:DUF4440 domain-containing protein [Vicinamibacterales bacterium]